MIKTAKVNILLFRQLSMVIPLHLVIIATEDWYI